MTNRGYAKNSGDGLLYKHVYLRECTLIYPHFTLYSHFTLSSIRPHFTYALSSVRPHFTLSFVRLSVRPYPRIRVSQTQYKVEDLLDMD
jgi:hypothetical protein